MGKATTINKWQGEDRTVIKIDDDNRIIIMQKSLIGENIDSIVLGLDDLRNAVAWAEKEVR